MCKSSNRASRSAASKQNNTAMLRGHPVREAQVASPIYRSIGTMQRFNLSAWAIRNRAVILFLIDRLSGPGIYCLPRSGPRRRPVVHRSRVMIVHASWPGATATRCRSKSPTRSRRSCRNCRISTRWGPIRGRAFRSSASFSANDAARRCRTSGTRSARRWATSAATCRQGVIGPFFNDEYRRRLLGGVHADGRRAHTSAELKRDAEDVRQRLLRVPKA